MTSGPTGRACWSKCWIIKCQSSAGVYGSINFRGSIQGIRKEMRPRNRLYKKFRRTPTSDNWNSYKEQRNKVTSLKRKSVKDFCFDAATDSSPGSVGLFWKKMKPLLPNRKPNAGADTIHLIEDGKVVSDPSSTFNEYFSTPVIFEFELSLTMEDFENHPSVVLIRNK